MHKNIFVQVSGASRRIGRAGAGWMIGASGNERRDKPQHFYPASGAALSTLL